MNRLARFSVPALVAGFATLPAFAAIDVTSATDAVADGSTAMLAVLGAIIGVGAVVWAMRKVIGLFGR